MIPLMGCLLLFFNLYRVAIRISDDECCPETKLSVLIRDQAGRNKIRLRERHFTCSLVGKPRYQYGLTMDHIISVLVFGKRPPVTWSEIVQQLDARAAGAA